MLSIRYEKGIISAVRIDWSKLMSTDFFFLNSIISMNFYTMILLAIEADRYRFNRFCFEDFLDKDRDGLKKIIRNWHTFQSDSKMCVHVDERLRWMVSQFA